ncbi:MAG: MerR family transcriptional regulator [Bacteroidales bacterium]|nr:MerR family transcriptional regulator [Lachnoclostridium sp.]MCM1384880.1 MerR family transcriptional regulator [Lachnoclostridium sp.]MCM1465590.1 MerR family transcriptional regulator [Bacteroidales bacterium]
MRYTTNDLAKILDVSTNTIRRLEDKGYMSAERDAQNDYRKFKNSDVEKLMYVGKYRKVGFGHEEITNLLQGDIYSVLTQLSRKKEEIDRQIAHYQALSHMLKDDILLIENMKRYGFDFIERNCSPMHYVLYMKKGEICLEGENEQALRRFMLTCPEFEYMYLFRKEDVEAGRCVYSEGVAANQLWTRKYGVDVAPPVESYESRPCVLRFMRVPLDIMECGSSELQEFLFGGLQEYMHKQGYILAGDAVGIKIGFSREENREWQYVLMHFPVEKA